MRGMDLERLLERGVAQVIIKEELAEMLNAGRPLRIKYGVDPSRPDIHLGHMVCFRKLRQLQDLGHKVIVIIGDWTARIGDPSDRAETRPMLTARQVRQNAQTYLNQFFKVVDVERADIVWQSSWFDDFSLADVIRLASRYTVAQMLARDDFSKRYAAGSPITIAEILYPLLQAYDSIAIEADVELGGTDQTFNLLVGREMQRQVGQAPQQIITIPMLVGTDGVVKMSKSLDNYIGVAELPQEIYGKLMSLPDEAMMSYFWLLTDIPDGELAAIERELREGKVNPRDVKMRLARELVTTLYDSDAAHRAEEDFVRVFRRREMPNDMPTHILEGPGPHPIIDLLLEVKLAGSRSEARRLIGQGGVRIDGERVKSIDYLVPVRDGMVLQVGRRRFRRLVWGD